MSLMPYNSYYDFDHPFRLMEKDFFRPGFYDPPFSSSIVPRDFFPDLYKPWDNSIFRHWNNALRPWNDIMKPMEQLSSAMNQLALQTESIKADDEKFQVNIDVQHFAPEEINVKVTDKSVTVEGKHEEKRDQHGYVARQFIRKYTLPEGCIPDTVKSSLSSDGILTVSAPRKLALPSPGEKIVPISHTGPIKRYLEPSRIQAIK